MENSNESISTTAGGASAPGADTGALDTGFEIEIESTATQMPVAASSTSPGDMTFEDQSFDEFVHSEKPAHDKLVYLSQMEDTNEIEKVDDEPKTEESVNKPDKWEPTVEQKIMLLQAEALRLFAGGSMEKNEKEMAELLKKLKELIETMQQKGEPASSRVIGVLLGIFVLMSEAGKNGTNFMDEEAKRSQYKN